MSVSTQTCTPRAAAAHGFAQRFLAAQVHNVNMRAGHLGKGHQMMHALRFHKRGTAPVMPFRPGLAFGEQLLLQLRHEVGIFAMGGRDHA